MNTGINERLLGELMTECSDVFCKLDLMAATTLLVISFLCMILFYQEWKRQKRTKNEQYIPYALMLLYLLLFISTAMIIFSNFFVEEPLFNILRDTKAYFIAVVLVSSTGLGIIVYIAERITRLNKYHFFLICYIIYMCLLIGLSLAGVSVFNVIFIIGEFPFYFLIGAFIYKLIWKTSGEIRKKMIIVLVGSSLFIIVFIQMIILILSAEFELMLRMKALLLLGSILTGYGFYSIPSFTEFDWDKKLRHLYVLNKDGLCLYQYPFRESIADQDLLGGSLMAIQGLMKEMIQTDKSLKVIDHEDTKLIFKQSDHAVVVMIADDDLYIIHHKLEQLLREFEMLFGQAMEKWVGNLSLFEPLHPIILRIFEIKQPKKMDQL